MAIKLHVSGWTGQLSEFFGLVGKRLVPGGLFRVTDLTPELRLLYGLKILVRARSWTIDFSNPPIALRWYLPKRRGQALRLGHRQLLDIHLFPVEERRLLPLPPGCVSENHFWLVATFNGYSRTDSLTSNSCLIFWDPSSLCLSWGRLDSSGTSMGLACAFHPPTSSLIQ